MDYNPGYVVVKLGCKRKSAFSVMIKLRVIFVNLRLKLYPDVIVSTYSSIIFMICPPCAVIIFPHIVSSTRITLVGWRPTVLTTC